jgi:glycosyltransferase involved in cell wall biosynthesis
MRVAIFSHGHPTFSKGGAEIAAYHLFNGINQTGNNEAWFIGRGSDNLLHLGTPIAAINEREYLISGNADLFNINCGIALGNESDFSEMLKNINPDVIHFHHYIWLGIEMIRAAKRTCPDAKIFLTLHEYIAICSNSGQMIKTDGRLCYQYSPRECALCFPDKTPEDFFLRERYIKSYFNLVDQFISPSEFLRQRYIDWGIPAEKIKVIENGLPKGDKLLPTVLEENEIRGKFAYFGQINPFKGVDVVMDAFVKLSKEQRKRVSLDIYGSGLHWQEETYQDKINKILAENKNMIRYHGSYESEELGRLMESVDWVVMGSIWWENSPLVIQEAYKFGKPVICPDIGGMAEKVKNGVSGIHYRARDSISLTTVIEKIIEGKIDYEKLYDQLPSIMTEEQCAAKHLSLYHTQFK